MALLKKVVVLSQLWSYSSLDCYTFCTIGLHLILNLVSLYSCINNTEALILIMYIECIFIPSPVGIQHDWKDQVLLTCTRHFKEVRFFSNFSWLMRCTVCGVESCFSKTVCNFNNIFCVWQNLEKIPLTKQVRLNFYMYWPRANDQNIKALALQQDHSSTAGLLFPSWCPSGTIFLTLYLMVGDAGFKSRANAFLLA